MHIHYRDQRRRLPEPDVDIEAIADKHYVPSLVRTKAGRAEFSARPARQNAKKNSKVPDYAAFLLTSAVASLVSNSSAAFSS
jgi:hypothetical protein